MEGDRETRSGGETSTEELEEKPARNDLQAKSLNIAELKEMDVAEVARITTANALRAYEIELAS